MKKTSNVRKTTLRKLLVAAFALAIISPLAKAQTMGGDDLKVVDFNSDVQVRNKTVLGVFKTKDSGTRLVDPVG